MNIEQINDWWNSLSEQTQNEMAHICGIDYGWGFTEGEKELMYDVCSPVVRNYSFEEAKTLLYKPTNKVDEAYRPFTRDNDKGVELLDEKDWLYKHDKKENPVTKYIPFTYGFLKLKLSWETICELTGLDYYCKNEGYEIKDTEVFNIGEDMAKKYNLL